MQANSLLVCARHWHTVVSMAHSGIHGTQWYPWHIVVSVAHSGVSGVVSMAHSGWCLWHTVVSMAHSCVHGTHWQSLASPFTVETEKSLEVSQFSSHPELYLLIQDTVRELAGAP